MKEMIGQHPLIVNLKALVQKVAPYKTTCLITGESGTGKELIAQMIHEHSPRRDKNFVSVNCSAIPENLLESELFGYVKGAFTGADADKKGLFEQADGGTLLLDEIAEMPYAVQSKLLRVLQEGEVRRVGGVASIAIDVRIISATHKELPEMITNQLFREDLFYRLNTMTLHVPSLRERKSDIKLLLEHFLKESGKTIDAMVIKKLEQHDWPGNIRELQNLIERALIMVEQDDQIQLAHLPERFQKNVETEENKPALHDEELSLKKRTAQLEVDLIKKALMKTQGNRTHAAKILEISHRALLYKLKEYNLSNFKG